MLPAQIRKLVASALLLTLCACAPTVAPRGPVATTPILTGATFVTSDGLRLPVRQWMPDAKLGQELKAVVLAVHGFNDYSKAFDKAPDAPGVGPFLAERGIAVYAYDQRGFGNAPHFGLWPGGEIMAEDFTDFARVFEGLVSGHSPLCLGREYGRGCGNDRPRTP